ncbi:tumor necrosis factor receptor superfamily member 6-like [Aplochiton taeniatus]
MITVSLLLLCLMSLTHSAPASNKVGPHFKDNFTATRIFRIKRQTCQDGTYLHEGITCCRCSAGQHLEKHCSEPGKPENRTCVYCQTGQTYNSDPNHLDSCEPCTSCNSKASLEVKDNCTVFKDTVCQCQQGHFCDKGPANCKACYPCLT